MQIDDINDGNLSLGQCCNSFGTCESNESQNCSISIYPCIFSPEALKASAYIQQYLHGSLA
jgi:hypothetical protein